MPYKRNTEKYEQRFVKINEFRIEGTSDEPILTGYAALYNKYSEDLGGFKEKILPGAFKRTLANGADVRALINHDPNMILGRTKNSKTLELWEDDTGLGFNLKLDPDITYAANLIRSIKRKDITQNSFGFRTISDKWSKDGKKRALEEVQLFDISMVTFPAYRQTHVKLRSVYKQISEIGIDLGRLDIIVHRYNTDLPLNDADKDEIKSVIELLSACLPEESIIEENHSETESLEEHSEEPVIEDHSETVTPRLAKLKLVQAKMKAQTYLI